MSLDNWYWKLIGLISIQFFLKKKLIYIVVANHSKKLQKRELNLRKEESWRKKPQLRIEKKKKKKESTLGHFAQILGKMTASPPDQTKNIYIY